MAPGPDHACVLLRTPHTSYPAPVPPSPLNVATPLNSLEELQQALRSRVPNDVLRGLINTRVFLRTGVNLKAVDAKQNTDAELVTTVLRALDEFGYNLTRP